MDFQSNKPTDEQTIQKDFAELFGPLMPHIRKIKRSGHIASFVTQAFAIYQITKSSFTGMEKTLMIVVSLFIAILIGAFIEGGISKIFPLWARQIFRWKFTNKWYALMFVVVSLISIPLVIFSPILSGAGASEGVEKITAEVSRTPTTDIEGRYDAKTDSLKSGFQKEKTELETLYNDRIYSIKLKYQGRINIQNAYYNEHKKAKADGAQWAQSHMDKATAENYQLKASRDEEIDQLKKELISATTLLAQGLINGEEAINADKQRQISLIDNDYEKAENKRSSFVFVWGNIGWYFAVFASLVVVVCIMITEVYRAGSGQDYRKIVDEEKDSKLDQLLGAFDRRVDDLLEGVIKGVQNGFEIVGGVSVKNEFVSLPTVVAKEPKQVKQQNETGETTQRNKPENKELEQAETLVKQPFQPVSPEMKQAGETSETVVIVGTNTRYLKQKCKQAWRRMQTQADKATPEKNFNQLVGTLKAIGIETNEVEENGIKDLLFTENQ